MMVENIIKDLKEYLEKNQDYKTDDSIFLLVSEEIFDMQEVSIFLKVIIRTPHGQGDLFFCSDNYPRLRIWPVKMLNGFFQFYKKI